MADKKSVFIAFAMEDEASRNLFTGQRTLSSTPYEFIDLSVKEQYETDWKTKVSARISRSNGVIVLLSASTPSASGQLWEIKEAVAQGKKILGIWLGDYRKKPVEIGAAPCVIWTWKNVGNFIDSL